MMKLSYLPNAITLSRIALVPVFILLLKDGNYPLALVVFLIAGASDALDGFLAKRLNVVTQFGAVVDPAADKILLVSAYVMLTILGHLPFWLTLTVAFRDLLIVGGYLVYSGHVGPIRMRPSILSKLNTLAQIALVVLVLVSLVYPFASAAVIDVVVYAVLATTVASGAHYLWTWGVLKDIDPLAPGEKKHDR